MSPTGKTVSLIDYGLCGHLTTISQIKSDFAHLAQSISSQLHSWFQLQSNSLRHIQDHPRYHQYNELKEVVQKDCKKFDCQGKRKQLHRSSSSPSDYHHHHHHDEYEYGMRPW